MAKTKHEIETKIRELVEAGKTDAEIAHEMDAFLDEADKEPSSKDDPEVPISKQLPKDALKIPLKAILLAALKDQDEATIRQAAADCADTLKEFSIINGLKESDNSKDKELFEACEKVYDWLYDQAWMEPKDGWKIESTKKVEGAQEWAVNLSVEKDSGALSQKDIKRIGQSKGIKVSIGNSAYKHHYSMEAVSPSKPLLKEFLEEVGLEWGTDFIKTKKALDEQKARYYASQKPIKADDEGEEEEKDTMDNVRESVGECLDELTSAIIAMDEVREERGFTDAEVIAYDGVDKAIEHLNKADTALED